MKRAFLALLLSLPSALAQSEAAITIFVEPQAASLLPALGVGVALVAITGGIIYFLRK